MTTSTPTWHASPSRAARRGLAIYLTVVIVVSVPIEAGFIVTHASDDLVRSVLWMSGLMLVPTLASVAARLVGHEGFADLGFRRGRDVGRYLAVALLLPLVVGAIAYGAAWSTGLVRVRIPPLGLWAALMTAILLLNVLVATGEELGWRGYMLRQMDAAGVPHPVLTSSLVWGAWHVPLFLWGGLVHDGPPPVVITGLVMVTTTALGYLLGRITLDTLNVWRGGAARRLEHRHPGRVRPCCRG